MNTAQDFQFLFHGAECVWQNPELEKAYNAAVVGWLDALASTLMFRPDAWADAYQFQQFIDLVMYKS